MDQQPVQKKGTSPIIWILLAGCGCFMLLCCAVTAFGAYIYQTDEFRDSYCEGLEEQDFDLSEDPLGICN